MGYVFLYGISSESIVFSKMYAMKLTRKHYVIKWYRQVKPNGPIIPAPLDYYRISMMLQNWFRNRLTSAFAVISSSFHLYGGLVC